MSEDANMELALSRAAETAGQAYLVQLDCIEDLEINHSRTNASIWLSVPLVRTGTPLATTDSAITADGSTATRTWDSCRIACEQARKVRLLFRNLNGSHRPPCFPSPDLPLPRGGNHPFESIWTRISGCRSETTILKHAMRSGRTPGRTPSCFPPGLFA